MHRIPKAPEASPQAVQADERARSMVAVEDLYWFRISSGRGEGFELRKRNVVAFARGRHVLKHGWRCFVAGCAAAAAAVAASCASAASTGTAATNATA